jgi:hypothetical protein
MEKRNKRTMNNDNNNNDNNEQPQEANQLLGEMWEQGQNANENADMEMDEIDDGNGVLDGGVAVNPDNPSSSSGKRQSSDCDLVRRLGTISTQERWMMPLT